MSIADAIRLRELEAALTELRARVDALEARQVAETPAAAAAGRDRGQSPHASYARDPPAERPPSAGDAVAVLGKSDAAKARANNVKAPAGNSPIYALRRLDRDRPDLAEKVRAGELSAHAAAVAAGFRKRMISVPADADAARRSGGAP